MIATAYAAEEAATGGITVHLAPEIIGHVGGLALTNTIVTAWFVLFLVLAFAAVMRFRYKMIPGKGQVLLEEMIGGAFEYVVTTLENRALARKVFPIIMTIFIFILSLNWIGLLPGVDSIGYYALHGAEQKLVPFLHPANTDLNITLAFAIIAFVTIELAGILSLGLFKYGSKFLNFSSPLNFVIGLLELVGELARLASFSFRLFGNVFAGKMLLVVAIFFIPFVAPVPILAFELFVGVVQALVFAILTLFFIKLAVTDAHH